MNRQLFKIWPGVCFAVLCVSALPAGPDRGNLVFYPSRHQDTDHLTYWADISERNIECATTSNGA